METGSGGTQTMDDQRVDHEESGLSPALLDALRPFLAESIMVLNHDWTVKANLAPPGGLIGRGLGVGVHTLEDMHPDDAIQVMDLGVQAFETGHGWQGSKIVRMRRGDGSYGRYEITATNCFDDPEIAGMVVRTRELALDPTDRHPDLVQHTAVETLAEMLPHGVILCDREGRVVFANENACGMLRSEPETLKREGLAESFSGADQATILGSIHRMTTEIGRERCVISAPDSMPNQRLELRFASEGSGGSTTSIIITLEDVTERDAARRDLEKRANHDPLTGLRNRASLHDLLAARLEAGDPTTVAFVDLDGFKAVNDTFGHERGDQLLIAIGLALRTDFGQGAAIARLGGDEFVVVTDPTVVAEDDLVERLSATIDWAARAQELDVSSSIGVARAEPSDGPNDVVRRADEAMYAVKVQHRAR